MRVPGVALALLAAPLLAAAERPGFPTDLKTTELDFPDGPNTQPYVDGVVAESSVVCAYLAIVASYLIMMAALLYWQRYAKIQSRDDGLVMKGLIRRNTLIGVVLTVLMVAFGAWAVAGLVEVQNGSYEATSATTTFYSDYGNALCADNAEDLDRTNCHEHSVHLHLERCYDVGEEAFDESLNALDDLRLLNSTLQSTNSWLLGVNERVSSVQTTIHPGMITDRAGIDDAIAWLSVMTNTDMQVITQELPNSANLPVVIDAVAAATAFGNCAAYVTGVTTAQGSFYTTCVLTIQNTVAMLAPFEVDIDTDPDNSENDYRGDILEDILAEAMHNVTILNEQVLDQQAHYEEQSAGSGDFWGSMFVWVFSLLLIPVLLMVCTLAWGRTSDKGRPYPMKAAFGASCCSVSANLILLVLIAIGAVVASDFCAVRREFVDYQVQGVNFTVGWDQVYVSDTFDDVLDCPVVDPRTAATYPWWRYDNNFIDIWGVGELFDISDEIAGLIAALNAAVTAIRPIDYDELALLGQGIPQSDPTAGLVTARGDLATYAREVEELADYVSSFSQPVQDKVASLAGYVDSLQGRMDALDAIAAETPGVRAQFEHEVATEAAGVSDDAIDDLQDTISALEEVARLTYETRNYALCGFVGGFWRDTVETTICYELEPTLNGATTGIFLTILATLVAFLWWLRLFVRAKLIARDAQKEIEGRGGASEAKSDAKAEAKATKAKPKQKKFGVFKARPGSMAAQMELAMQREANAV